MNPPPYPSLADDRHTLRRRMLAQRQLIAYQLEPVPRAHPDYPRSATMRFLSGQPLAAAGLIAALAKLLIGAGFIRTLLAAFAITKATGSSR